jgi:hypothetical protein
VNRPLRTFWNLAAVGGAIAVGLTTHNSGYIVITFLGGLIVPRILGLAGPGHFDRARRHAHGEGFAGHGGHPCGPWSGRDRLQEWHSKAHEAMSASPPAPTA